MQIMAKEAPEVEGDDNVKKTLIDEIIHQAKQDTEFRDVIWKIVAIVGMFVFLGLSSL